MIDAQTQQQLLCAIYDVFAEWAEPFPFACRKGCAACCTRSVTMTTLEGQGIMAYLDAAGRKRELATLAAETGKPCGQRSTTNTFVGAHLKGEGVEDGADFDMRPCPLLRQGSCSIYPVRPFGCRLFASMTPCGQNGAAEMPPGYLAAATAMLQCIEHLDSGGRWGTLVELLAGVSDNQAESCGEATVPIPGFLIAPDERAMVEPLLHRLLHQEISGKTFEQWLQEARS